MKVKNESEVSQSCPTLHNPMDHSLPGSSVNGIFQARVLEWGAIAFCAMQTSHIHIIRIFILRTEVRIHLVLKTPQQVCVHTENSEFM